MYRIQLCTIRFRRRRRHIKLLIVCLICNVFLFMSFDVASVVVCRFLCVVSEM